MPSRTGEQPIQFSRASQAPASVIAVSTSGRRVVVTGAAGTIARAVSPMLPPEWDLHLTDVQPGSTDELDVTDLDACRTAFAGADAVVHLAAGPDPTATWEDLLPANVIGAYHVVQAAIDSGVRRLVLASSLQAMSGYPFDRQLRTVDAPMPANLYGASKACWRRWARGRPPHPRPRSLRCASATSLFGGPPATRWIIESGPHG